MPKKRNRFYFGVYSLYFDPFPCRILVSFYICVTKWSKTTSLMLKQAIKIHYNITHKFSVMGNELLKRIISLISSFHLLWWAYMQNKMSQNITNRAATRGRIMPQPCQQTWYRQYRWLANLNHCNSSRIYLEVSSTSGTLWEYKRARLATKQMQQRHSRGCKESSVSRAGELVEM